MKIKLLKKVRKRFQIFRIDELSSNPTELKLECAKDWGLPFYVLKDTDTLERETIYCANLPRAKAELSTIIHETYKEQFKHKPEKNVKVWWTKQISN